VGKVTKNKGRPKESACTAGLGKGKAPPDIKLVPKETN
jgi:hypothetical protein